MSSIDFKKKEKLNTLVAQALLLEGAFTETGSSTSAALSEGVKTALVYINNAQKDVAVSVLERNQHAFMQDSMHCMLICIALKCVHYN